MNIALLLAAGEGRRFGSDKLFEKINGISVVELTLKNLHQASSVDAILIAASAENLSDVKKLSRKYSKVIGVFRGGVTRFDSVLNLIKKVKKCENLIIQNAASPFVDEEIISLCLKKISGDIVGVAPARKVFQTVKKVKGARVIETVSKKNLRVVEVPQVVKYKEFVDACNMVGGKNARGGFGVARDFTDDLSVLEAAGFKSALVLSHAHNIKITTREDLEMARFFAGDYSKNFAVGIGEDSHAFTDNSSKMRLRLCGITVDSEPALDADSDGDVVLHALCNAIAVAIAEGSLGGYATKIARGGERDSSKYLEFILKKAQEKNMSIQQCSISIEAARPKIDPLVLSLKKSLSRLLKISELRIGITAHSGEKLSPFGRGEGVRCLASVTLTNNL